MIVKDHCVIFPVISDHILGGLSMEHMKGIGALLAVYAPDQNNGLLVVINTKYQLCCEAYTHRMLYFSSSNHISHYTDHHTS